MGRCRHVSFLDRPQSLSQANERELGDGKGHPAHESRLPPGRRYRASWARDGRFTSRPDSPSAAARSDPGEVTLPNPSIKGSAITSTVEDVQKLVQTGVLSEHELERRLTLDALALVRQPIAASQWYDMRAVTSVVELLWEVE